MKFNYGGFPESDSEEQKKVDEELKLKTEKIYSASVIGEGGYDSIIENLRARGERFACIGLSYTNGGGATFSKLWSALCQSADNNKGIHFYKVWGFARHTPVATGLVNTVPLEIQISTTITGAINRTIFISGSDDFSGNQQTAVFDFLEGTPPLDCNIWSPAGGGIVAINATAFGKGSSFATGDLVVANIHLHWHEY